MPDNYRVTASTKSGEKHQGLLTRSQPEVINGSIAVAREETSWNYLAGRHTQDGVCPRNKNARHALKTANTAINADTVFRI